MAEDPNQRVQALSDAILEASREKQWDVVRELTALAKSLMDLKKSNQRGTSTGYVQDDDEKPPSLRDIARAVGRSHTLISLAMNGHRPIKRSLAKEIEKAAGTDADGNPRMPATRDTYPRGFSD